MTVWAVIPARPPGEGKSRLAEVLSPGERERLSEAMLAHVAAATVAARNVGAVYLLGPERPDLAPALPAIADPGGGLNPALRAALTTAAKAGATRIVFVAGDLPRLTTREVELLAAAAPGTVAIAPDRHGTGTNALSLPLPEAAAFAFAFGPDSFARHHAEARRLGLPIEPIHGPGLARDIDEPADLPDAAALRGPTSGA